MELASILLKVCERNKKAVCVCVVYVHVSVWMYSCRQLDIHHVCVCAEAEVNDKHPRFLSALIFETRSLSEFGAHGFK